MSIFSIFSSPTKSKSVAKPEKKKDFQPKSKPQVQEVKDTPQDSHLLDQAQAKAREIVLEARDEALKIRESARQEAIELKKKADEEHQKHLVERQKQDRLTAKLEERDRLTRSQSTTIQKRLLQLEELKTKWIAALEKISNLTESEAKSRLMAEVEKRSVADAAKIIKNTEEKAHEEAESKAREILVDAMYAGATDYVPEYTVSTIKVPDEETKGRVIGKDGRNIRTFEKVTGVDVDLDEQGLIKLSCFDSVRREVARVAMERLIRDGRIHPTHIEDYVDKARRELEKIMYREGERLCHAVGVYNLPKDLIGMLGRFKYRTSYGQNMIAHTLEETKIGMKLASEVGADLETVKLGCLLHDIGKVLPDQEGSHVELGVKLLRKYNLAKPVIDAVAQHHEDEEFSSVESVLVYIADAISGSRPGARYENYEEYVERLSKLEEIATKHKGVKEAYAIQAGREVRVIIDPEKIGDAAMVKLASDIKDEIQSTMTYPGTVKVSVIRETRATQTAT
jgi:ribonuclease Y